MVFGATEWPALAIAILTGIGSIVGAWASIIAAKHKERDECHQKLLAMRAESETFSEELHKLRMQQWVRSVETGQPEEEV